MYWLKQCTKCGGDLASNSDQYGPYVSCMQCGQCQDMEIKEAGSLAIPRKSVQPLAAAVLGRDGCLTNIRRSSPSRRSAATAA